MSLNCCPLEGVKDASGKKKKQWVHKVLDFQHNWNIKHFSFVTDTITEEHLIVYIGNSFILFYMSSHVVTCCCGMSETVNVA